MNGLDLFSGIGGLTTIAYGTGGRLNPAWVEWLMNYPFAWTELNRLVTPLFQRKQKKHLKN
jgi:hypothetical protein